MTKKRKPESFLFCLTNHDTLYPISYNTANVRKKNKFYLDKSYLKLTFVL